MYWDEDQLDAFLCSVVCASCPIATTRGITAVLSLPLEKKLRSLTWGFHTSTSTLVVSMPSTDTTELELVRNDYDKDVP